MNHVYTTWLVLLVAALVVGIVGVVRNRTNWKWSLLVLVGAIIMRAYATAIHGILNYAGSTSVSTGVTIALCTLGTVGLVAFVYGFRRCLILNTNPAD